MRSAFELCGLSSILITVQGVARTMARATLVATLPLFAQLPLRPLVPIHHLVEYALRSVGDNLRVELLVYRLRNVLRCIRSAAS
jgi:hypothetical protein